MWRIAKGVVTMENESPQNPDCAMGRARWNAGDEVANPSGIKIAKVPPATVLGRLDKSLAVNLVPDDINAFAVDMDGDESDEVVYVASNLNRIAKLNEQSGKPYPFVVQGGILGSPSSFPAIFFHDRGEYLGGTNSVGNVVLKEVVPIAASKREIAVLAKVGGGLEGKQYLLRFHDTLQMIQSFEFRCN